MQLFRSSSAALAALVVGPFVFAACPEDPHPHPSEDTGTDLDTATAPDTETTSATDVDVAEPSDDEVTDTSEEAETEGDAADGSEVVVTCLRPGEFGCPCSENDECNSGLCIEARNFEGRICTQDCLTQCPPGFDCRQISASGADPRLVCVDFAIDLCRPCRVNADCQSGLGGGSDNRCLQVSREAGAFCGAGCPEGDCPDGYECKEVADIELGQKTPQCVPADGAECECSAHAKTVGAATSCWRNLCEGKRACLAVGPASACDAPVDQEEVCDDKDNNCDGRVDPQFPHSDDDTQADCVDLDDDNDGVSDESDNCPLVPNVGQGDRDGDHVGDVCDTPGVPTLTGTDPNKSANAERQPMVLGTADSGVNVSVFPNGICAGDPRLFQGVAGDDRLFKVLLTVPANQTTTISARAQDGRSGLASECTPVAAALQYVHDDIAPRAPAWTGTTPVSPGKALDFAASGTAEVGATVALFTDLACTAPAAIAVTPGVAGAFTFQASVADGASVSFYATATDIAGNVSPCSPAVTYTQDGIAPLAPRLTSSVPASPASGNTPDDTKPTLVGSSEPNSLVTFYTDAACTVQTGEPDRAGPQGFFAIAAPAAANAETWFYATATDAAGNVSGCSAGFQYIHDNADPASPVFVSTDPVSPSNEQSPAVKGTAELGAKVRLYLGGDCTGPLTGASDVLADGTWEIRVTVAPNSETLLTAIAIDTAGRKSACTPTPLSYVHDGRSPLRPIVSDTSPRGMGAGQTIQLLGTAEAGATVTFYFDEACSRAADLSGLAGTDGAFAVTTDAGANTMTQWWATATDAAKNTSPCSATHVAYTHDGLPPAAPTLLDTRPESPSSTKTPTVVGMAEAGAWVELYIDLDSADGLDPCVDLVGSDFADAAGNLELAIQVLLEDASNSIHGKARDAAGNWSDCTSVPLYYVHDSSEPLVPTIDASDPVSPSSTSTTPTLTGTAEAETTVEIHLADDCSDAAVTSTAVGSDGTYSVQVEAESNGIVDYFAMSLDTAGNYSQCSGMGFRYEHDSLAPAAPELASSDPASPTNGAPELTLRGTAEAGATVTLFANADCTDALSAGDVVEASGEFAIAIEVARNVETLIYAHAKDPAGNRSSCSAGFPFVHDAIAPGAPTLTEVTPAAVGTTTEPSVAGTAEAGAAINVYANADCVSGFLGKGVADAGGAFIAALTVGANQATAIYAAATDTAGNTGACSNALQYRHDDIAPPMPTWAATTTPPSPSKDDTTPGLAGTAEGDARVRLFRDEACTGAHEVEVAAGANGAFAFNPSVGANTRTLFYAQAVDAAQNPSPCSLAIEYVHDGVLPEAPILTGTNPVSPALGSGDTHPLVLGNAEARSTVEVFANAACTGVGVSGMAAADRSFAITATAAANATTQFSARATDLAGNRSPCSAPIPYLHDDTDPTVPVFTSPSPATVSGDATPAVAGTRETGTTVRIYPVEGCLGTPVATIEAAAATTWSVEISVNSNRETKLSARATDAAGRTSACTAPLSYTHDDQPPARPSVTGTTPSGSAKNANPTVNGTAEANTTVKLWKDAACTVAANAQGPSGTGAFAIAATVVPNTPTTFYATATDLAQNKSLCSLTSATYTDDEQAPAAPVFNGAHPTTPDSPSSTQSPTVNGTAEAGSMVKLFTTADCTGPAAATGPATGGAFAIAITVASNQTTQIRATATDSAGNTSGCTATAVSYQHDSIAPVVPVINDSNPHSPTSTSTTPTLMGTAAMNVDVYLYRQAGCTDASPQIQSTGASEAFSIVVSPAVAPNATTTFYAKAKKTAGTFSQCSAGFPYIHDNTAPAAPTGLVTDPASGSRNQAPKVSGNAEPNARIEVFANQTCSGAASVTVTAAADGTFSALNVPVTVNTTNKITAKAFDAANNPSPCSAAIDYRHDGIAPAAPVFGTVSPGAFGTTTSPTINGTAEAGSTVRLYSDATCTSGFLNEGLATAGAFAIGVTVATNQQTRVYGQATDAAGNVSICGGTASYTHDNVLPAAPTWTTTNPLSPANGAAPTPTLSGLSEANASVRLYRGNACTGVAEGAAAPANASGQFTLTAASAVTANGTTTFYAKATDQAGNPGPCSVALAYEHDNIVAAPTIGASDPVPPNNDSVTPTLSGTGEAGATLTLYTQAACAGAAVTTVTVAANGSWQVIGAPAGDNTTTNFTAKQTDRANNLSACSGTFAYTHDTTPPLAPTNVTSNPASPSIVSYTPTVSGTLAETGVKIEFFKRANCAPAEYLGILDNAPLVWTSPTLTLPPNVSSAIWVKLTDALGNVSACTDILHYKHDNVAPPAPVITASEPNVRSNSDYSPTFSGTNQLDASPFNSAPGIGLFKSADCSGERISVGVSGGSWTSGPIELGAADGVYSVSANACDLVGSSSVPGFLGNCSPCSAPRTYEYDTTPPSAPGTPQWTGANYTSLTVGWTAATDNLTSQANLVYRACVMGSPTDACNWTDAAASNIYYSAAGATSIQVQGGTDAAGRAVAALTANKHYNVKVRAADQTGNLGPEAPLILAKTAYWLWAGDLFVGATGACARYGGTAKCWGAAQSKVGTYDLASIAMWSGTPATVTGATNDNGHMCFVTKAGNAYCLGAGIGGQLGTGQRVDLANPTLVKTDATTTLEYASQVDVGALHTCVVTSDNTVRCWGTDTDGALGNGSADTAQHDYPVTVVKDDSGTPLTNVMQISVGDYHACAAVADGTVWCWGRNAEGQLGNGTQSHSPFAVKATSLSYVVEVVAGAEHTCSRNTTGTVFCWGKNDFGQLGTGSTEPRATTPTSLAAFGGVEGATSLTSGGYHTCATYVTATGPLGGQAKCWGRNTAGELGNGDTAGGLQRSPVSVKSSSTSNLGGITQIRAGGGYTCARHAASQLACWGSAGGALKRLGNNSTSDALYPVPVSVFSAGFAPADASGVVGVAQIDMEASHGCVTLFDGRAKCWGSNLYGQLGRGTSGEASAAAAVIPGDPVVAEAETGGRHTCIRTTNGEAYCAGRNDKGQLGRNDKLDLSTALWVGCTGCRFADLDLGDASTCALTTAGGILCWGDNANGRLLGGGATELTVPTAVPLPTYARSLSVGFAHQCVVDSVGDVYCWGVNDQGQVTGTAGGYVTTPTKVVMPATWLDVPQTTVALTVTAGSKHTCAQMADRTNRCWGTNAEFEHGYDTNTAARSVEVVNSQMNAGFAIVAGGINTAMVKHTSGGALFLWGGNTDSTFGNVGVTAAGTHTPQQVPGLTTIADKVVSVVLGDGNVCALLSNAFVNCWGRNAANALGNALTTGVQTTPARHQWLP